LSIPKILRFLGQNALLGVALLLTLAASAVLTMRVVLASRDVAVPSLAGRVLADATVFAAHRGLALRVEGRRHDPAVPADRIVAQEPPPGATLKAHRAVRVWVSLGPRRVTVPPVEGESARTARIALEQSGVPVDRVVEIDGDRFAAGIKNVTFNEEFFQGHFPGHPVMPGVLQIEAMAQLAGVLLLRKLEHAGKIAYLLSLDSVKLRRTVVPGDQLRLEAETVRLKNRIAQVNTRALVDGQVAAEAQIKFMLVDAGE